MNRRYGLKIWSINADWVETIIDRYNEGYFHYVELFAVPHSFDDTHLKWGALKDKNIPVIIHGAHSGFKVNWAEISMEKFNQEESLDGFRFADWLGADTIVFHPGFMGNIDETVRQLSSFNDKRIVVENKPHKSKIITDIIFRGSTPDELAYICDKTGYQCCIDVAHAICSANSHNEDGYEYVKKFLELDYRVCHISDNYYKNEMDIHLSLGKGEYDFKKLLDMIKKDVYLTIETPKKDINGHINDVIYLRKNA